MQPMYAQHRPPSFCAIGTLSLSVSLALSSLCLSTHSTLGLNHLDKKFVLPHLVGRRYLFERLHDDLDLNLLARPHQAAVWPHAVALRRSCLHLSVRAGRVRAGATASPWLRAIRRRDRKISAPARVQQSNLAVAIHHLLWRPCTVQGSSPRRAAGVCHTQGRAQTTASGAARSGWCDGQPRQLGRRV